MGSAFGMVAPWVGLSNRIVRFWLGIASVTLIDFCECSLVVATQVLDSYYLNAFWDF
jgi:hypothetical protein